MVDVSVPVCLFVCWFMCLFGCLYVCLIKLGSWLCYWIMLSYILGLFCFTVFFCQIFKVCGALLERAFSVSFLRALSSCAFSVRVLCARFLCAFCALSPCVCWVCGLLSTPLRAGHTPHNGVSRHPARNHACFRISMHVRATRPNERLPFL